MDCQLQKDIQEINASYKQYPQSPKMPLYGRGVGGIILNVLLHLGVMTLCISPGIVLVCVSRAKESETMMYIGIGAFIIGGMCMIGIISYIDHLNKKLLENRSLYWAEKSKVLM
jgi:hypothetical protein